MPADSMITSGRSPEALWADRTQFVQQLFAAAMLIIILLALLLFWPIPQLGFAVEREPGVITAITPASAADRAGLRANDRIIGIYNYRWEDVERQLILFPLSWETVRTVPIRIDRQGTVLELQLAAEAPHYLDQIEKITGFLLGFICWIVGYILGQVRRHNATAPTAVAYFWMGLGGILGSYTLASYGSYPAKALLLWLLLTLIVPYSVYTHVWFPARPVSMAERRRALRWLGSALVILQGLLLAATLIWHPTLVVWIDLMVEIVPTALVVAFLASSVLLWHAYRSTTIAHVQRQIRIMLLSCLLTLICWVLLRSLPTLTQQELPLPHYLVDAISCLVPIAYLACGIVPDLNRLDRILQRISVYILAAVLLGIAMLAILSQLHLSSPQQGIWMALSFVALYRPSYHLVRAMAMRVVTPEQSYELLDQAATQLAGTLDIDQQVHTLCNAIQSAFDPPQIACYIRHEPHPSSLSLAYSAGLQFPNLLPDGKLIDCLAQLPNVASVRVSVHGVGKSVGGI